MLEDAFAKWAAEQSPFDPTEPAGVQHCLYCFDSLYSELNSQSKHGKSDDFLLNNLEETIGTSELYADTMTCHIPYLTSNQTLIMFLSSAPCLSHGMLSLLVALIPSSEDASGTLHPVH